MHISSLEPTQASLYSSRPHRDTSADQYRPSRIGNLHGFPPVGQNSSTEFDKCLAEAGCKNTPWDLKLFFKWTAANKPMIIIAYSNDFCWFGTEENLDEWDSVVKIFNKHGYQVTDATDKEFVGIKITLAEQFNYYMDQHRMIDSIIAEANMRRDFIFP